MKKWLWYKAFNITGTVQCGERLDEWCALLNEVLKTDNVGIIGHFTGANTVCAGSNFGYLISTGFDIHDFLGYVPGEHGAWLQFGQTLEAALRDHGFPYSLVVHECIMNDDAGRRVPAQETDRRLDFADYT